jgi:hypothetical protein
LTLQCGSMSLDKFNDSVCTSVTVTCDYSIRNRSIHVNRHTTEDNNGKGDGAVCVRSRRHLRLCLQSIQLKSVVRNSSY